MSAPYSAPGALVPYGASAPISMTGKNWSSRFAVYQIDFSAVASGKRIAGSKRRIRWRFGFSNRDAIEAGQTGTACRGEEHDIIIVWSVTSGKRHVTADGNEVHYSVNRTGILEYSWTMRGNHVLKVVAHAAPQMSSTPNFRQYNLFVDGQSFFNMPKVFELGIAGPGARIPGVNINPNHAVAPQGRQYDLAKGAHVQAPQTREQEEADLQKAISESIEESRQHLQKQIMSKKEEPGSALPQAEPTPALPPGAPAPAVAARGGGNLLEFGGPAPPMPPPALPPSVPTAPPPVAPLPTEIGAPVYNPPPTPVNSTGGSMTQPSFAGSFTSPPPPSLEGSMIQPSVAGSFTSPPPPPSSIDQYPPTPDQFASPPPVPTDPYASQPPVAPTELYAASLPPAPTDQFAAQPTPTYDQFAPQPTSVVDQFAPAPHDPFAPQPVAPPTVSDIHNEILGAYGGDTDSKPADVGAQETVPPTDSPVANGVQLSINTALTDEKEEEDGEPVSEVDKAFKMLVNIDDITSPVEGETKLSIGNPFEEEKEDRTKMKKSKAIPPPAKSWAGPQPTLQEIQAIKPTTTPKQRNEPVMKTSPFDPAAVHSGALVVHGQQAPNQYGLGGPPPLPSQGTGFGVGAQMPGGGYGAPPQQGYGPYGAPVQPGYGAPYGSPPPPQPQYQQPPPPQQGYGNYTY